MSSKPTRSLSFRRFCKTNLNTVLSAKSRRRSAAENSHSYESLEARQLLTADVGINFTTANDGSGFDINDNPPNIAAAVGENHIVQFTNNSFTIFDKADTPTRLQEGTLVDFFNQASGGQAATGLSQPRLVFDTAFDRWYVVAVDNTDLGTPFGPQSNAIWLAASNTPDPTGSWKAASFTLAGGTDLNIPPDGQVDDFLTGSSRVTLSVDEYALSITAQESGALVFNDDGIPFVGRSGTAIITLPQVALFGGRIETERAEVITGLAADEFGAEPQFVFDTTMDPQTFPRGAADTTFMLAIDGDGDPNTYPVGRQGNELILTELARPGIPNVQLDLELVDIERIPIPFYREPDVVRQPTDIIRDRDSSLLNATIALEGDFIYTAHSVRDQITLDDGTQAEGPNAVIRWYKVDTTPEIDPDTGLEIFLVDSGVIRAATDDIDYIDPSIDVSPNGTVAIGYTATGIDLFPSSYASIGVPSAGVDSPILFNEPTLLKAGESTYIDFPGGNFDNHFWGRYTTTVNDPYDPNSFWTFQQYTDDANGWAIQATQFGAFDSQIVIEADNLDNIIEVNQVGDNIEVVIDGAVVGVYDSDGIGQLTINGNGGFDQFFVNVPDLDSDTITGNYILVGDGDDTVSLEGVGSDTIWQFDGSDGANVNNGDVLATGMVAFQSGTGDDRFQFPTSNYDISVSAGDGNDVFVVEQDVTGNLALFGQVGDDVYNLPASSFVGVAISDSVGFENDQLTSTGTDGQDIINVDENSVTINGIVVPFNDASTAWGIETFAIDAYADDDTFNITSTTREFALFGQRGSDTFNVNETSVMTGFSTLMIDGGADDNSLNVTQNDALAATRVLIDSALISNMTSAEISFVATGGTFGDTATSSGITIFGSDTRADIIEVLGVDTGNDLTVLGRAFNDRLIFENNILGTAELLGGAGNDRYEANSFSVFDVIVTDTVDSEADVFYVAMTSGDDVIEVDAAGYTFNGLAYPTATASFTGVEDFLLDGLGGADTFNIDRTTTVASFRGSDGDDVFNVTDATSTTGETEININGGTGNNTLNVARNQSAGGTVLVNSSTIEGMTIATINYIASGTFGLVELTGDATSEDYLVQTLLPTSLLRVNGQDGDDDLTVVRAPEGNVELVGGNGSDTYRVYVTGDKARSVTVVDPAAQTGSDRIEVAFTAASDAIVFDGPTIGLGSDIVVLDAEVEVLAAEGIAGNDTFMVLNPVNPRIEMLGGAGDDMYEIATDGTALNSEIFIFDSVDAENDSLVVSGTNAADVFDVNEGSVLVNGSILIPTTGDNIVGVESISFDGQGSGDTFNINSTTRGFNFLGSDGGDVFNVTDLTSTTGASEINIDGGIGIDELHITRNEFIGTQAVVNSATVEGMTIATVNYGGITLLNLNGSDSADDFVVETLLRSTLLQIDARDGDDMILVQRTALGDADLTGGAGSDTYRIEVQGDKTRLVSVVDADADADRAEVVFTPAAETITLAGSSFGLGNDGVNIDPAVEVLALEALGGDDVFDIINPLNPRLELFGQAGDDAYNILDIGALSSEIFIFDSVGTENDTLLVNGTAGADSFIVNQNAITINGAILSPAAGGNINGVEGVTFDGLDADDTFTINSTTRGTAQGFTYLGSGGNDRFFIREESATTGADSFVIDGGTGSNEMFVDRSVIFGGAVAGTEIQIENNRIVGMTTADINYLATDGIFSLIETRGTRGDTGGDDVYNDIFRVNSLSDATRLVVNSFGGDDLIDVIAGVAGDVEIDGGFGNDSFIVELAGAVDRTVTVNDTGADGRYDRLDVFFSSDAQTINVFNTANRIVQSVADSDVNYDPLLEGLALHGLGGDDRFVVTGTTTDDLILAGGEGDDTYELANVFGDTAVSVLDSVNAENDRLLVDGTNGDDTFIINENSFLINGNTFIVDDATNANIVGIESLEVDALDGDDTFIVNSATRGFNLLGGDGNDHFMIHDTAPDAGADDLVIDGGTGANTMEIQRIEGTPNFVVIQEDWIRNAANSTIRYSATGGSFTGGNGGITITGLDDVNDSFLVFGLLAENSLQLHGVGGNDYHRIAEAAAGDVWMDGADGRDRYVVFLDEDKSRNIRVADSGTADEIDRINTFLTQNSDIVVLDGTEVSVMSDSLSFMPTIETVEILAGGGDDEIDVRQFDGVSFLRIKGEAGNDVLSVNGAVGADNVVLIGENGNDTFDLVSATEDSYVGAYGNAGEDLFVVGEDFYRRSDINGGEDDDRYDISFADRGTRRLKLADSGQGGNDTAIVRATDVSTRMTLRASGINTEFQLVATTRQIESLELIGTEGRDVVTMFAAPVVDMEINTLTGSDILNINSNNGAENLDIDLGAERDIANIFQTAPGTSTTLNTGRDDDLVNLGSSLASDSGNLDSLQGALAINLGQGSDRLYLNDSQSSGAHGYTLTESQAINNDAIRSRTFSGVSYSGAEFLQVRGNEQFNQFTVTPSATVKFLLDGNMPQNNALTVTGSNDGRQLFMSSDFAGIWNFDSLRGVQFDQFAV